MSRSSYSFNRAGGRNAAMPFQKYRPFQPIDLPDRQWPSRTITKAPRWCSVDLRDGNQALIDPMRPEEKLRFWNLLLSLGLEEIEVGFPAASQTDFDFVRKIITENRIPEAVTIQVLCQAREELIARSVDAIAGAKRAIFHLYNSTSTLQRRVVFGKSRQEIIDLALEGVELVKREVARIPETEVILEYSPESFTGTELDFAVEVCSAVAQAWGVGPDRHDHQPAGDGGDGDAEHLRRPDRVVLPQPSGASLRGGEPPHPQRPGHGYCGLRAGLARRRGPGRGHALR